MPPLGQAARQALALLLCASLIFTTPGLGTAFAQAQTGGAPEPTAAQVMAFLDSKEHSIFKGPDDPLRSYIKNSKGAVTPLGWILYKYLKAQANVKEEVAALDPSFETLRKKGVYAETGNETMNKSLKRLEDQFKTLLDGGDAEDTFTLGAQREAIMTGIASAEPPKQDYTQVDLPDNGGWEFWDKDGVAFKMNHHRVIIYNRELQKQQRELNKSRDARAPFIPETGRYNVQMIENSYWRLRRQHEDLELSLHMDRMLNMAELLGKQYMDDQWLPQHQAELESATKEIQDNLSKWQEKRMWNKDLEAKLEKWAKAKVFSHNNKDVSIWDIVESKTNVRAAYLKHAQDGIARFKVEMDAMSGLVAVTDAKVAAMQSQEAYVLQRLSLAYLENQKYYVKNQLERLDPDSPDYQAFEDAMDGNTMRDVTAAPMDAATKKKYKEQRAALQARLQRLMEIFGTVHDTLVAKSYASNLDIVQAALNSSQKEMGEVALDAALYTEIPSVWGFADKQLGWRQSTYSTIAGWFGSSHTERMSEVGAYMSPYKDIASRIADGNYKEARALVIKMHPDAAKFRALGLDGVSKVTDQVRLTMSLQQSRETLMKVDETNKWVRTVSNFVLWSVGLGLGARLGSAILSAFEYGFASLKSSAITKINNLKNSTAAAGKNVWSVHPIRMTGLKAQQAFGAVGEGVFQQTASSLRRIIPTEPMSGKSASVRYLQEAGWTALNAGKGQLAFTGVSGVISGGFTMVGHWWDGSEESMFAGAGDAFYQGAVGGVHWANESWHPALGYVGLPSSIFNGTKAAAVTEVIGSRGVLGMTGQVLGRTGKFFGWEGLGNGIAKAEARLQKFYTNEGLTPFKKGVGYGREVLGIGVGTFDQVAKFALFSQGLSLGARFVQEHWLDQDEPDLERRIKRINHAGNWWMESAAWLLLPQFPAVHAEAAAGYQRSVQGYKEYKEAGRLAEIANHPEDAYMPLLGNPKIPLAQRIFSPSFKVRGGSRDKTFLVGKLKQKAIAEVLLESVPGGGKDAKVANLDPFEFLRISRLEAGGDNMYGNLRVTEDLQIAARDNFTEGLRRNQKLAQDVLNTKAGKTLKYTIDGKDYDLLVTLEVKEQVAISMYLESKLDARPKELKAGEERRDKGPRISKELVKLAETALKRHFEADNVAPHADAFMRDLREVTGESASESKEYEAFLDSVVEQVKKWKLEAKSDFESYLPFLAKTKAQAKAKFDAGKLTAKQYAALESLYGYVDAIEVRFNAFNKPETARAIVAEQLEALKTQYEGKSSSIKTLLEGYSKQLESWYAKSDKKGPGDNAGFATMMSVFGSELDALSQAGRITHAENNTLKRAIKDMKASPWALHNIKGDALKSWKTDQFEGLMISLAGIARDGRGGGVIREFTQVKTGAGKTLLAFEGLLPLAEADVRYFRKKKFTFGPKPEKVTFLTVQGNLEAQARLDFIALKKVKSEIEFGTYESFKAEIAEAKSSGKNIVERHWILGDEMDGAALQPALTLGEMTGKITRWQSTYVMIEKLNTHMKLQLGKQGKELSEAATGEVRRGKQLLDELDVSLPEVVAARLSSGRLLKAVERLAGATTPEAKALAHEGFKAAAAELRAALDSPGLSSSAETFSGLHQKTEQMKVLADKLGSDPLAAIQLVSLSKQQDALLGASGLAKTPQARAFSSTTGKLRALLKDSAALTGGARTEAGSAELAAGVKELLAAQRKIRDSQGIPSTHKARLEASLAKVETLVGSTKELTESQKKDLKKEFKRSLREQETLLGLIGGKETQRLESLREKAREQLSSAESRVEKLKERIANEKDEGVKAGLRSQLERAEKDVTRARRFAGVEYGRAQNLIEKLFELKADEVAASQELGELRRTLSEKENAELDAHLADAARLKGELSGTKGAARKALETELRLVEKKIAAKSEYARARTLSEKAAALKEKLAEGQKELAELRSGLAAKENAELDAYAVGVELLRRLGSEMGEKDAQLLAARKKGQSTDTLAAELLELDAKAGRARVELGRLRRKALESRASRDLGSARKEFEKSAEEIQTLVDKGEYAEASRLLEPHGELLEAFGKLENPIYETYREMKEETHAFAYGREWNRDISVEIAASREASGKLVETAVAGLEKALKELKETSGAAQTPEAKALREKAEGLLSSQLEGWKKVSEYAQKSETLAAEMDRLSSQASYFEKKGEPLDALKAQMEHSARKKELEALRAELEALAPGSGYAGKFPELKGRNEADRLITVDMMQTAKDLAARHETERAGLLKSSKSKDPLLARLESEFKLLSEGQAALDKGLTREIADLQMTDAEAAKLLRRRIEGDGLFALLGKMLTGRAGPDSYGMIRRYAWKLLWGVLKDPVMPYEQRHRLMWKFIRSVLLPKGSMVHEEIANMVQGHSDDPQTIRMDNISGNTNVVHNGQWFETMDNPTRRYWELHFGTDITLPYTHKALSTIKDLSSNKSARFVSLSATAGRAVKDYLTKSGVRIAGPEAIAPKGIRMRMTPGGAEKFSAVGELVRLKSKDRAAFRPKEVLNVEENLAAAPKEVRDWVETQSLKMSELIELAGQGKLPLETPKGVREHLETVWAVHEYLKKTPYGRKTLSEEGALSRSLEQIEREANVTTPEMGKRVREYFEYLRGENGTDLIVVSLSGTRELKAMRQYLERVLGLKESEIAEVISDSEYLRTQRPEANIQKTMNLKGMVDGKVRVLLLDTRVGGRGLDLDYKGRSSDTKLKAFKGYTNYEMLVLDPHEMSAVHTLQAMGRIDVGRVLKDAPREFQLVMDVKGVQKEPFFKDMFNEHPLFLQLRDDPRIVEFAREQGQKVDWALIDAYMKQFEVKRLKELEQTPADLEMRALQELFNQPKDLRFVRDFLRLKEEAALMRLKDEPAVLEFAASRQSEVTPQLIRDYLRHNDGAAEKAGIKAELDFIARYNIVERYELVVKEYLEAKQNEVEENQLKSSSVLNEPIVDRKLEWFNELFNRTYEGAKTLKR